MNRKTKIFIIVTSVLAVAGIGYIGYTLLRIRALNRKISTPKEVSESIKKVAEENPNAQIKITQEEIDAAENGKFGNNGESEMTPVLDFTDITDEELNCYVYNICDDTGSGVEQDYSYITEDDTIPYTSMDV